MHDVSMFPLSACLPIAAWLSYYANLTALARNRANMNTWAHEVRSPNKNSGKLLEKEALATSNERNGTRGPPWQPSVPGARPSEATKRS